MDFNIRIWYLILKIMNSLENTRNLLKSFIETIKCSTKKGWRKKDIMKTTTITMIIAYTHGSWIWYNEVQRNENLTNIFEFVTYKRMKRTKTNVYSHSWTPNDFCNWNSHASLAWMVLITSTTMTTFSMAVRPLLWVVCLCVTLPERLHMYTYDKNDLLESAECMCSADWIEWK